MAFKTLQIRYQTARSLPAPYAYFYTLTAKPISSDSVQLDLSVTYPDRDDIDDDELIAEGYTRDDDFSWSGRLPKAWLQTLANLVTQTRLQPLDEDTLGEDDDFWDVTIEQSSGTRQQGRPIKPDDWQYLMQELMQAVYESMGKERPFELSYLNLNSQKGDADVHLTASFTERSVTVVTTQNRREQRKTLPWSALQRLMADVYAHEYDPDEAQLKRPKQDGHWLNLGTDEWYNISGLPGLTKALQTL
ncbi:hypothetical protein [Spirosoma fluminis]